MANADILKEYLITLGIKDDFSDKLKDTLKKSSQEVKVFAKGFAIAGGAIGGLLVAANTGIAKFAKGLVKADEELINYAKGIGKSKDEAFKLKSALDAMGKSMEEIEGSEELTKTFKQLQKDSAAIEPPDLSEGLKQAKEIQTEFIRMKQSATYAIQWIGHYLFKYLQQPMQKIKEIFSGLNNSIINNMPKWTEKIASVMAAVARIGLTIIRGAAAVFNAVKRIFDMIPKEIKMIGTALAALALFIRAGPVGKLLTIISIALLLLEDFYTYIDGGNALLGRLWQKLIDIGSLLRNSGIIDFIKDSFVSALGFISDKIQETKKFLINLYDSFKESGSIEKFRELLKSILGLLGELAKPIKEIGKETASIFSGKGKSGLEWFVQKGLPDLLDLLIKITKRATDVIGKLNDLGVTEKVIKGLLASFLGFKALKGVTGILNSFTGNITKTLAGLPKLLSGLKGSVNIFGAVKGIGKLFASNPFLIWIAAITALIGVFALLFKNKDKLQEFIGKIKDAIKSLVEKIVEMLPELIETGKEILRSVIDGIIEVLPQLMDAIVNIVNSIIETITEYLPVILQSGIDILTAIIKGIVEILPQLIKTAIKLINEIIRTIVEMLPNLISAGIEILSAIISGIIQVLPQLIEAAITLIFEIVHTLIENLPAIIEAGIQILSSLIEGIVQVLPELIEAAISLILAVAETLIENLPQIIEAGIKIIGALISGIIKAIPKLIKAMPKIVKAVLDGLSKLPGQVLDVGVSLVKSLWEGILSMGSWISDKISGFVKGLFKKEKLEIDIEEANPEDLPHYAEGGVVSKEQIAHVAEGDKPEVIIPLTKPARAKGLMSDAMSYLGMDDTEKIVNKLESLTQFTSKTLDMVKMFNAGINQDTSYMYNTTSQTVDNRSYDMHSSYTINDTSGRPEAVANAIDRTKQMQLRNLQGILQ